MTIFGQKLLSILCLLSVSNGLPAEHNINQHTAFGESRHLSRFEDSGFMPIIPSQIDPHPSLVPIHSDPHLNPILTQQKYYSSQYRNDWSTSRPFSLRHIGSSSTSSRYAPIVRTTPAYDQSMLGSGDFAVLRGGTFYHNGDEKKNDEYFGSESIFLDTNTGRPFALPVKQPYYPDDPFADFKDFADITAGVDSDFSHLVVVYANKNSTKHEPRNILEQLQLLDQQKEVSTNVPIKYTKQSKFKTKLRSTKATKEHNNKKYKKVQAPKKLKQSKETQTTSSLSIDYVDPLVADS